MSLTLNQFLLLVLTLAVVIAVAFLIMVLIQIRKTASEGEKTLLEFRELARNLGETQKIIREKVNDIAEIIDASKKTALQLTDATAFLTARVVKPSFKYLPLALPLLRFLWRQWKKRKEEKHGRK